MLCAWCCELHSLADAERIKQPPSVACVYALIDGERLYIGQTSNLKKRLPKHKYKDFPEVYILHRGEPTWGPKDYILLELRYNLQHYQGYKLISRMTPSDVTKLLCKP